MNQPAQREDKRLAMPKTADFVKRMREQWGTEHVNACLKRAQAGEPGFFYAIELCQFAGTPFPQGHPIYEWQANAILWGVGFAVFMATPEGINGAH
jgi:hypothetical protein